jgi:DNA-directed RNA polymerase subunit RPC12/RpoP
MNKIVYVCTGTCKAEISEEQFKNGLTKCGAEGCTLKGHDFAKRLKCQECGAIFEEKENHSHA